MGSDIMDNIKSIRILLGLIYDLYHNKKYLNDDFINNYKVSSDVCKRVLEKIKVNVNIIGTENIPVDGPLLLAPNHISFFDIILLLSVIDRPLPFAAAVELMSYPILRDYISALKCVLINRETNDMNTMREQIDGIQESIKKTGLIVFPEGECSYNQEIYDFKKGAFLRLKETSVVPTYINTPVIKKIGKWTIPTDNIDIIFGKPFVVSEVFSTRAKAEVVAEYTKNKVLELKRFIDN